MREALDDDGKGLDEQVARVVRFVYQYYSDHPDELAFVLLTRPAFPQQQILDKRIDPDEAVLDFIRRQMKSGGIPAGDPVLLMSIVRGIVIEPILMHRYGRLRTHPLRLARRVASACTKVLQP